MPASPELYASFETTTATIRVHRKPKGKTGSGSRAKRPPYIASASVLLHGGEATVIGLTSREPWTPEHHEAFLDALRTRQVETVKWERVKDGEMVMIERAL